jgi:hypothetical protein
MTPDLCKPSRFIARFRNSFRQLVRPGRVLTELEVARLSAEINTAHELAAEYEFEMIMLESTITPVVPTPAPSNTTGVLIPIRRRPALRLVSNDGGDAA